MLLAVDDVSCNFQIIIPANITIIIITILRLFGVFELIENKWICVENSINIHCSSSRGEFKIKLELFKAEVSYSSNVRVLEFRVLGTALTVARAMARAPWYNRDAGTADDVIGCVCSHIRDVVYWFSLGFRSILKTWSIAGPVSYTHLTLPTILRV